MAKTNTPLFSMGASGSVATRLVYQQGSNSTSIRWKWKQPVTDNTETRSHRTAFQAAKDAWNYGKTQIETNWAEKAEKRKITVFAAWLADYIAAWSGDGVLMPDGNVVTATSQVNTMTRNGTPQNRGILWSWGVPAVGPVAYYFVMIRPSGITEISNRYAYASVGSERQYLQVLGVPGQEYRITINIITAGYVRRHSRPGLATFPA